MNVDMTLTRGSWLGSGDELEFLPQNSTIRSSCCVLKIYVSILLNFIIISSGGKDLINLPAKDVHHLKVLVLLVCDVNLFHRLRPRFVWCM